MFLSITLQLSGQTITGRLIDEDKQPVGFANVVLQQMDSSFVAGSISKDNGEFSVTAKAEGNYILVVSFIGYNTERILIKGLMKKQSIGNITLTTTNQTLNAVTVTASNTSRKIDKQLVMPTQSQIKASSSGVDLLAKLMLPGLKINTVQNSVSTVSGGEVEIRINDIKATQAQLMALSPENIIRVEYIDNPGARYGDTAVEAVINYIVKKKSAGVSGGIQGMNAITTGFGNDNISLNANFGKSEFGIDYLLNYREYDKRYANETHTFVLPDGSERQRYLKGLNVPFGYTTHSIETSYNLTEPDKYIFNILLKNYIHRTDKQNFAQQITEAGRESMTSYTHAKDNSYTPSIDIYYQYKFLHKQKLSMNIVGTYINTDYLRDYKEYVKQDAPTLNYVYTTNGKRYSVIGEAIYNKEWQSTVFSAGIKGNFAYTQNIYAGSADESLRMHDSNLYGYAQLQGKLSQLNYIIGAGASRQAFSQASNSYTYITFRPSLSLSYPLFRGANIRYTFSLTPYVPSLAQLSEISKQITDIEVEKGNSGLKPYDVYWNRLVFSYEKKRVSLQLTGRYNYYSNPIVTTVERLTDNNNYMYEYTRINGKNHKNASAQLDVQWKIIPDYITVSGYYGVNWSKTTGYEYINEYTGWNGGIDVAANYKKWSLQASIASRYKSSYGEYITYGDENSYLQLTYKFKNLTLGATWMYPLNSEGWSSGSVLNSKYVKKEEWTFIKDNSNMISFYFNWKFNSGRKHYAGEKTMNNADTDSGVVK